MPASTPFQFTPPYPASLGLNDGEKALSPVAAGAGAPARTTYYLSRLFDFEGGTYTFRVNSDDTAAFFSSIEKTNGKFLFSHVAAQGTTEFTVFIGRGRQRLDIVLGNLSAAASPCFVAFSIRQFGKLVYTSASTSWLIDTAPIEDSALPALGDARRNYPVFPLLPNWQGGVTERLEWMTEILPSESDVEQRRSQRRYARRSIEASFLRKGVNRQRLDYFFNGMGKAEVLLPLWHEQFPLGANLGSTLALPAGTAAQREFLPGTLALVYESPTEFEVLTISGVDYSTDTVSFASPPLGSWGVGHRVIPLRVARLLDAVQFENLTDEVATARARFSLKDPEKWPNPSWGYCSPLFRFPVDRAQAINIDFSRSTFTLDNEVGPVDVLDLGERTRVGMRVSVTLRGRDQVNRMRAFIHNARGRAVRFWMPSLMSDLSGWGDLDGSDFEVRSSGFAEYMRAPQDSRRMLCIEFNDGRPNLYRTVVAAEPVGDNERIFVEPALPPIPASIVAKMFFVMPVRFDQDGFEFQHPVDDSAVVRTSLVMRSADMVDMPPIECLTTSRPYPLNDVGRMASLGEFVSGRLQENLMVNEAMRVTPEFTEGTLIENVESYTYRPFERLASEAEFVGGEIEGAVEETTAIEAMQSSVDFLNGTLIESLVAYSPAAERIEVTPQFLEGTLA